MVRILTKCSRCGKYFIRGVYPQKLCERCDREIYGDLVYCNKRGETNGQYIYMD